MSIQQVDTKVLFEFINTAAEEEQEEQRRLEDIKLRLQQEEKRNKEKYIDEIKEFFGNLFGPCNYLVDITHYQVLSHYPYLYISCHKDHSVSIWGTNMQLMNPHKPSDIDEITNWSYDFVSALFHNKENILMELAYKYGYTG